LRGALGLVGSIDQETLVGVGRAVEFMVFGGEFGEIFGGFGP